MYVCMYVYVYNGSNSYDKKKGFLTICFILCVMLIFQCAYRVVSTFIPFCCEQIGFFFGCRYCCCWVIASESAFVDPYPCWKCKLFLLLHWKHRLESNQWGSRLNCIEWDCIFCLMHAYIKHACNVCSVRIEHNSYTTVKLLTIRHKRLCVNLHSTHTTTTYYLRKKLKFSRSNHIVSYFTFWELHKKKLPSITK